MIAPVEEGTDDITVDRYFIDGVLPWDGDDPDDDDTEGDLTIWLVGGEERDVNAFLDAIEQPGGTVTVKIVDGLEQYSGTSRNGVTTSDWL